ncbi:DUF4412 domain-containing protein [Fibrobacterota bacterium]
MKMTTLFLTALCLQSVSAGFKQGFIQFKLANPQGSGVVELKISEKATRSTIKMDQLQMKISMDFLIMHDNPNLIYQINDESKTYSVMDLSHIQSQAEKSPPAQDIVVKKLGEENILGYKTTHVRVIQDGQEVDMWVSKDIEVYSVLKKLQAANSQASSQLEAYKALEKKGLEGFPMKTVINHKGTKTTMEVVKLEEKSFPQNTFKVPNGYTQTQGFGNILEGLSSPENMQALQKMMQENLTPEKIEELKKMMEKAGQQQEHEQE